MPSQRIHSSRLNLLRTLFCLLTVVVTASLAGADAFGQGPAERNGRRTASQKPEIMRWRVVPKGAQKTPRHQASTNARPTSRPHRRPDADTGKPTEPLNVAVAQAEYHTEAFADDSVVYAPPPRSFEPSACDDMGPYCDSLMPSSGCGNAQCTSCDRRNSRTSFSRLVGRAEYLLWWTSGLDTPPLATTSPVGTGQDQAGVLGQLGTSVLFGDNEYNDGSRPGGRYTIGLWDDDCQSRGWEFSYLHLGNETTSFSASNANTGILARPFFNETTNAQDARLIAFPGVVDGSLNIDMTSKFQSAEALYRWTAQRSKCGRMEYLLGYRFAELDDGITIAESTLSLAGPTAGTSFDLLDQFDSKNTFHGGQFGIACQWQPNRCWSIDLIGKLALGATQRQADVTGRTLVSAVGNIENPAGLLTQGSNIGSYSSDNFTTITEFGVTLNRHFSRSLTANFGYTFLYWNDVARAGDQIDLNVNTSQIPPGVLVGAARPAFAFRSTDFWAQGLRFGLELQF
ncbi:hypothetical protein TBK1r_26810 [Stieleria magnilauensis]|uniref:BBP7 family outer membrane beta-barrel protein n=2 Tax=Stieleria magnilauensis TaxID=2527963 RepID=A0ABX5XV52_9BACT|nr:hypothetical protein TBK1r_26810 [Planctomycetes bacterium TBK1r]